MNLYILYRFGFFMATHVPVRMAYAIANIASLLFYYISYRDRRAVITNLRTVLGSDASEAEIHKKAKEVFKNFAKYLADFFRFSKVDIGYVKKYVKIEGLEYLDEALKRGKGVIALSAHIGNWELGGGVLAMLGYPLCGVVLTHQDKRINDFFRSQRMSVKMKSIEVGAALKSCYKVLKSNGCIALLGDRDFAKNGLRLDFFGRDTLIPKGPAFFSYRLGSAMVPCFMVREPDDTFKFIFEKPILPEPDKEEGPAIIEITKKFIPIMEAYIRKYPTQWFVFKDMWNNHEEEYLRPDTIL